MNFVKFTLGQAGIVEGDKCQAIFDLLIAHNWTAEDIWADWSTSRQRGQVKFNFTGISCFMWAEFDNYQEYASFVVSIPTGYNFSDDEINKFYKLILDAI